MVPLTGEICSCHRSACKKTDMQSMITKWQIYPSSHRQDQEGNVALALRHSRLHLLLLSPETWAFAHTVHLELRALENNAFVYKQ